MSDRTWKHSPLRLAVTFLIVQLVSARPETSHSNTIVIKILERDNVSPMGEREHRNTPAELRTKPIAMAYKQPEMQKPQIQIQLLKGHVDPSTNWGFSTEYEYSGKHFNESDPKEERKEPVGRYAGQKGRVPEETNRSDGTSVDEKRPQLPQIGMRTIVEGRVHQCAEDELRDIRGICRKIVR